MRGLLIIGWYVLIVMWFWAMCVSAGEADKKMGCK